MDSHCHKTWRRASHWIIGHALVASVVVVFLQSPDEQHDDHTAAGVRPPDSDGLVREQISRTDNLKSAIPKTVTTAAYQSPTPQYAESTPFLCNTSRQAAWNEEINRLLQVGPNVSHTFKELQGRRSHLKLGRVVFGYEQRRRRDARIGKTNQSTFALKTETLPAQYCSFFSSLGGTGPCATKKPRILVFGGSMTWGTEPMKRVRRTCPGCPPPSGATKGKVFTDTPHCCSWPNFLQRWFNDLTDAGLIRIRPAVINLAVPASSTKWLASQVRHIIESTDGGMPTACDLVLLDYSVNDAAAKELYDNNETDLELAVRQVIAQVFPASVVIMPWYPFRVRQDRWGSRTPGAFFNYHRPYKEAARRSASLVHNMSNVIEESGAGSMFPGFVWPHPPWEQHSIFARFLALFFSHHAASIECARPECLPLRSAGSADKNVLSDSCDQSVGMWAEAKDSSRRGGKARGWSISVGSGWSLYEDRPGKPGWIFSGSDQESANNTGISWQTGQSWAPWLAHGLRKVRVQISFLQTYANAAAFEVSYCGHVLTRFDSMWKDKVSLVTTKSLVAEPCRKLSRVGQVEIRPVFALNGRSAPGKIKIVSVAICPASSSDSLST